MLPEDLVNPGMADIEVLCEGPYRVPLAVQSDHLLGPFSVLDAVLPCVPFGH